MDPPELFPGPDRSSKEHDEAIAACYGEAHTARRRVVFFLTRAPGPAGDPGHTTRTAASGARPDGPARARGCTTGPLEE